MASTQMLKETRIAHDEMLSIHPIFGSYTPLGFHNRQATRITMERFSQMTWPVKYKRASQEFERFMVAARDAAGLATTNMAWTMVEGVLLTFRRRLTVPQTIEFANVLPPILRALFLEDWHPSGEPEPFASREALTEEVCTLRAQHNFSPANAIEAVAIALRGSIDEAALNAVLARLPPQAAEFWAVQAVISVMHHSWRSE